MKPLKPPKRRLSADRKDEKLLASCRAASIPRELERVIGHQLERRADRIYMSQVTLEGRPVDVAIAFSARSNLLVLGPLGQINPQLRALTEMNTELVILQHSGRVGATAVNFLNAAARRRESRYVVLDGSVSALICRTYGRFP